MIFKHLFTPKWKHPKTEIRQAAVDKLDLSKDATILQTLALEDDSAQIRKKVLHKVNDLALWWKAYKQDQELKELAEQKITSAILTEDSKLDSAIRVEYIEKHASTKLLEKIAISEQNTANKVKLLKRIGSTALIEKSFKEGEASLQLELVPFIFQYELEKQVIKSAKGEAKAALEKELEQRRLAEEMPKLVAEKTRVILAKMNALRDKQDFLEVNEKFVQLQKEWQALELTWLNAELSAEVDEKYSTIISRIEKHIETIKAVYEAAQAALQFEQRRKACLTTFTEQLNGCEKSVVDACKALDQQAAQSVEPLLNSLMNDIASSEFNTQPAFSELQNKANTLLLDLAKLPEHIEKCECFNQKLSSLKSIEPTNDLSLFDERQREQKKAYQECRSAMTALPKGLQKQAKSDLKEVSEAYLKAIKSTLDEQNESLKQARKKARDVQRLIDQGRFKVAFGVFNGFLSAYELLTDEFKKNLEKQHETLSKTLSDLKDWQQYASAPKRDELLAEIAQKLDEEVTNPKKRADEVKMLRVRWNELGRAETTEEKQQAKLFDEQIEKLFAPCREYFAEQETLRAQAKDKRLDIIKQFEQLHVEAQSADSEQWRNIESQFNKLNKLWREAGNVDSKTYQALNDAFREHQVVVSDLLKSFHQSNAAQKQALVDTAAAQLEQEDLQVACDTLKELQKEWQTIGFAGAKLEHALWRTFRQHNDAVFEKRSAQFAEHKQKQAEAESEQRQLLAELDTKIIETVTQSGLLAIQEDIESLTLLKSLNRERDTLMSQVKAKLDELCSAQMREKMSDLIAAINEGTDIPDSWKGRNKSGLSAEALLLRLEILTGLSSPEACQAARMEQQVKMLDDKLQGQSYSFEQLLICYLSESDDFDKTRIVAVLTA